VSTEYRVRHRDGSWRWVADHARLVRDAGGRLVRMVGITVDVTDDHARAEAQERQARVRTERLQRLSADLTRGLARARSRAWSCGTSSRPPTRTRSASSSSPPTGASSRSPTAPGTGPTSAPATRASGPTRRCRCATWRARARPSTWGAPRSGRRGTRRCRVVLPPGADDGAWAALPLLLDGRMLGALTLSVRGPHAFPADERRFLQTFADLCAQALERARLFEAESTARDRAEALQRVTAALAGARTTADVGRLFSREVTALLAADTPGWAR
jgi:hypothetical protein